LECKQAEWGLREWVGLEAGLGYVDFIGKYWIPTENQEGGMPDSSSNLQPIVLNEKTDAPYIFAIPFGVRFRPFNDQKGYKWSWGGPNDPDGNLWGNLFIDLHGNYLVANDKNRFGLDFGLGAELSVLTGLQVGPFVRGMWIPQPDSTGISMTADDLFLLLIGLSISIEIPPTKGTNDNDGDGILNDADSCPDDPEDKDGFEDEDGCPEADNDDDGILDADDKCPNDPEDKDGFEDEDGCPDGDNDGDGIPDATDKCPQDPEDKDGFQDEDGCPEADNDGDGIPDDKDKCPNEAETVNGYEDEDGCPEGDRDGDEIIDQLDKCPDEPEVVNGVDDEDGCPDEALVKVVGDEIMTEKVFFAVGKYEVVASAKELVADIVKLLETHPEYKLVSIEGHADKTGGEQYNLKLSQRRADAVKAALVKKGIAEERLVAIGRGELQGDSAMARKMNRNVTFIIKTKEVPESPVKPAAPAPAPAPKPEAAPEAAPETKPETTEPKTENPY
jgi:outer membrane protein OmpA-like peptidoglycan-associated protein